MYNQEIEGEEGNTKSYGNNVRLHFDIYNQNGNLFDYETTLRLECIKWQLPLFHSTR